MTPVEEIAAKMDALGLWSTVAPYNWAIKPHGSAFPYFCTVIGGDGKLVKTRFLMLEGWQTMHDYVHTRIDRNFGCISTPMELPHYELIFVTNGEAKLFRYDTGYVPREADEREQAFCAKMLWEAYGVMLRVEADRNLPMSFAAEKAVFARVESADGKWSDAPLSVPDARPHVECVKFSKKVLEKAKDLPNDTGLKILIDFRILAGAQTSHQRPRAVYSLMAVDAATGGKFFESRTSVDPEAGLKAMWESMPERVLEEIVGAGRVPGEIALVSGRVFRMLRALCVELPFKLSLHDSLPALDAAFAKRDVR